VGDLQAVTFLAARPDTRTMNQIAPAAANAAPVLELPPPGPAWTSARERNRFSRAELARRIPCSRWSIRRLEQAGGEVSDLLRRLAYLELRLACGGNNPFDESEV
jgi:hypothetical protein